MRIKIILIPVLCILCIPLKGQFAITVSTSKSNICADSVITFTAAATNGGSPANNVTFTWSFGDGKEPVSGFMLDTITNVFRERGGYIIRVDATDGTNSDYAFLSVQTGLKANFTGTSLSLNDSICLGQEIFMTGVKNTKVWKYKIPAIKTETNPVLFNNLLSYTGKLDYRIFTKTLKLVSASNIDTVGIKLEHSNTSSFKIMVVPFGQRNSIFKLEVFELRCPNGTTMILKDFGGPDKYFGEPVDNETAIQSGVGYNYYWTNSPTYGTMNSQNPSGLAFPSGSYTPNQSFTNLAGCPLNGNWEIIVTDNQPLDNGFVFEAQLTFNSSLLPTEWEYNNTYSSPLWIGNGVNTTTANGLATANPTAYGNLDYKFRVKDNFGCFEDTTLYKFVEKPTFTTNPEPPTKDINDTIGFTNKTTWATTYEWDFGDHSPVETTSTASHSYSKSGNYWAKLTVETADGCSDTASVVVVVTIPESVDFQMANVFSPNGNYKTYYIESSSLDGVQSLECYIYSRWGKKVAEWHSIEDAVNGWDGTINGGPKASPGVYYYYIKVVGYDNVVYKKQGALHLF